MQIFRMESSDRSDKITPRANQLIAMIVGIYICLSVLCAIAYALAGMTTFEAVNHAMTTVSTGGYSTSDLQMAHFDSALIHWLAVLFMIGGSLPFVLYIQALRGRPMLLIKDSQVQTLVGVLAAFSFALSVWMVVHTETTWPDAIRLSAFNVTSVVTTTGYALTDYTLWGPFAIVSFFWLTFVGGCSGSTAGGFKIYRFQILLQGLGTTARKLLNPHGVFPATYGNKVVDREILMSVYLFTTLYFGTILVLALALSFLGLDMETALSAAATAVANVGPGIGPIVGPAGNFATLPDTAKWLLTGGMILGRLEIATMAIIVMPAFWRK